MKYKIGDRVKVIDKQIEIMMKDLSDDEGLQDIINLYKNTTEGIIIATSEGLDEPFYGLDIDKGFLAWNESELILI